MAELRKMTGDEIRGELPTVPAWCLRDHKLHREFEFPDFVQAFGFMTQVALVAQSLDHHPAWFNEYNRVAIDLVTHDVDGISERDFALARRIDALLVDSREPTDVR